LTSFYGDDTRRTKALTILNKIDYSLGKYVTLKSAISLVTGALSYFALEIIGVDFAFFWAFLIFLLNFIPNIGSLVATLFPALIAGLQFGDLEQPLLVLVSVGAIQLLVGNFLEPRLMGDSLNISSLVVILGLAFWGALWGIVGMFLSVPIMVMLVIILSQFQSTRGVAILLSDKGDIDKIKG
jgi:predicted PurR-regulated permease PerM